MRTYVYLRRVKPVASTMVAAASAAIATTRIAYLADLPSFALMPIPITAVARVLRRR